MSVINNLSVRSDHSIGESIMQVSQIIETAKEFGYKGLSLVDTMSISSLVDFTNRCKKAEIKPIIGCTIRVYLDPKYRKPAKASGEVEKKNPFYQLKVYVKSDKGIRGLMKLLTIGNSEEYFYYHSRVGLQEVLELEDVIITTGDIQNLYHIKNHDEIIKSLITYHGRDNVFSEIVPINTPLFDTLNQYAVDSATRNGLQLVVGYPCFYNSEHDAGSLDVLRAITSNSTMDSRSLPIPFTRDMCFIPANFLAERVIALSKRITGLTMVEVKFALLAIEKISGACNYAFEKQAPSLPKMTANDFLELVNQCKLGWAIRFENDVMGFKPDDLAPYKERLAYEMRVIRDLGFSTYFLVVQDIVQWTKKSGIFVGPGRGSCFLPGHSVILDKSRVTKFVENVEVGDTVIAHDGSIREVIAKLEFDRDEEIVELEFDNGINIKCTKDHLFYTKNRGWVQAEFIDENDEFDDVAELNERKGS